VVDLHSSAVVVACDGAYHTAAVAVGCDADDVGGAVAYTLEEQQ